MAAERTPLIAANWKMHKTTAETEDFLNAYLPHAPEEGGAEVFVCPPFTSLQKAVELCGETTVRVAAQHMHDEPSGAFTGEVAAPMLADLGVAGVILGHSERRALFGETDEALARKLPAAFEAGLVPILCVGETEAEREAEETEAVLSRQLEADLAEARGGRLADLVIAYEPVWAIGTGNTATSEQAQEAIAFIRGRVAEADQAAGESVRILYGGSVKPGNAAELLGQADIDGALVGGASLDPEDFAAIVEAA